MAWQGVEYGARQQVRCEDSECEPQSWSILLFLFAFPSVPVILSLPHLLLWSQDQNVLFVMRMIQSQYLKCKQYRKVERRNHSSTISPPWQATVLPDILYLRTHTFCSGSITYARCFIICCVHCIKDVSRCVWYAFDEGKLNLTKPDFFAVCANFLKERLSKRYNFQVYKIRKHK